MIQENAILGNSPEKAFLHAFLRKKFQPALLVRNRNAFLSGFAPQKNFRMTLELERVVIRVPKVWILETKIPPYGYSKALARIHATTNPAAIASRPSQSHSHSDAKA
jgi:hypothetical protein